MRVGPGSLLFAVGVVAAGAACRRSRAAETGGSFELRWTGSDTGRMAGRGTADWCGPGRYFALRGIQGDTGVGVAIYPKDSAAPGRYPVRPPVRADSAARPTAAVVVRWFGETAIEGFQAESGTVVLEAGGGAGAGSPRRLSGRLEARAAATGPGKRDTLTLTGAFSGVEVGPAKPGCADRDTLRRAGEQQLEHPEADTLPEGD